MSNTKDTTFADWLKNKRDTAGLSLRKLAALTGVSHSTIAKAEDGGWVRDSTLELLVKALAGEGATEEQVEAVRQEARAARGGVSVPTIEVEEVQSVRDSSGAEWTLLHNLSDPHTAFSLTPEAARVLAALGLLSQPSQPQPTDSQDEA